MNNLPKKKKPTINPFSCFIKDFQDSQKTKGIFYKNFEAAATEAKVIWDSLTEEEREYYKEKAKEQKTKIHGAATKYTTNGISFDEIDRQKMQQKKEIQEMEQEINSILQTAYINGNLVDQEFYFISTTDFCQTLQGDIFPAELAMIKFSLREGVMDSLHMHIDPGKLPLGFTADAQDKSDSTHKLKIPPFSEGISDFYEIYKQILNFVGSYPSGTIPAIYTNHMEVKVVRLTVAKILKEAERDKIFKIYPLEELFSPLKMFTMQIKGIKKKMLADKMIVRDVLQRDLYAYCSGLGCEFHDTVDSSIHCNLSKVKRWAFSIADYCFADLVGVEYKLG
jgi:protein maelstrom